MKKFAILLTACLSLSAAVSNAQNVKKCCTTTTVAPALTAQAAVDSLPIDEYMGTPSLAVTQSSDLPNIEYLVARKNTPISAGSSTLATVILGASTDGTFSPYWVNRYGVKFQPGDTLEYIAVGYNLSQIKTLGDSLLNGTYNNQPCCGLADLAGATDFCTTVNGQGIYGSNDINSLNDVLAVFDAFLDNRPTVDSVANIMETINNAGSFINPQCGGTGANDFLAYGMDLDAQNLVRLTDYKYTVDVKALSNVTSFMVFPNPSSNGTLNVNYSVTEETALTLNLYNVLGRRVQSQNYVAAKQGAIQLNVAALPAGVYNLELTDGVNSRVQKVVIR